MKLLIDMDGVIVDLNKGFREAFHKMYPGIELPEPNRENYGFYGHYPQELHSYMDQVVNSEGFNTNLPIMPGAKEALEELVQKYDLFICSTPSMTNTNCAMEKYDWVKKHFGQEWLKKIILTYDKTIVDGDILVDDKPFIKGVQEPNWEQILYTQPYNKYFKDRRRLTWDNWQEVI